MSAPPPLVFLRKRFVISSKNAIPCGLPAMPLSKPGPEAISLRETKFSISRHCKKRLSDAVFPVDVPPTLILNKLGWTPLKQILPAIALAITVKTSGKSY